MLLLIRDFYVWQSLSVSLPDLDEHFSINEVAEGHRHAWIRETLEAASRHLGTQSPSRSYGLEGYRLSVTSSIPVAAGLGSGAAVATALTRAYAQLLDRSLSNQEISDIVFEVSRY